MIVLGTALVGLGLLFKDNFLRAVALIWTGELEATEGRINLARWLEHECASL